MEPHIEYVKTALDAKMRLTPKGWPYWYARDLMEILGYARWENFRDVIEKAIQACDNSGKFSSNHVRYITEMIEAGKGAKKKRENAVLSKYASYLVAMNGDPSLPQIGTAQTYFAVQTHAQEIEQSLTDQQRRLLLRNRVKDANKKLIGAAKAAGVTKSPIFHDAGSKGLYGGRGRDEIKRMKRSPAADELLDCIDREELAANEFRITQTEAKLKRDGIRGEQRAIDAHFAVGKRIRQTIQDIHGTMPEHLPAAPSIKKLSDKQTKDTKELIGEGE